MTLLNGQLVHGSASTYTNRHCRCDECKAAKRAYDKGRYELNQEQVLRYKRKYTLKKFYGITIEEYDALLERQGHGCAVCGRPESDDTGRRLHVDHDHATGEIRGLLCNGCNRGIGYFDDSVERMNKAIRYLEKRR